MTRKGELWSRDELLVAFNLYCRIPFGSISSRNREIIRFAGILGRTPSALSMKMGNFASLDPIHRDRGVKGLRNIGNADRAIWKEFHDNWELLAFESQQALLTLSGSAKSDSFPTLAMVHSGGKTEALRTVRARLVQGFFRETVLTTYNGRCAICRLEIYNMLNASHIIPWSVDKERRADPTNGLSLCVFHDRAFDRGIIAIDEDYRILVSESVKRETDSKMHTVGLIEVSGKSLELPRRFQPDPHALSFHRNEIFREE